MTSNDVRDMLDLPGTAAPRPAKKAKVAANKPKLAGLAREVQSLGGDNPISIVPEGTLFKKKRWTSRKPAARWERVRFKNSARAGREDDLMIKHWWKVPANAGAKVEGEGEKGKGLDGEGNGDEGGNGGEEKKEELQDSLFAKYNVPKKVYTYTDEQYEDKLKSDEWTRHETDYLMEMVSEYDSRWNNIWDRYEYTPPGPENADSDAMIVAPKERSMEDLKARFYFIQAKMMEIATPLHEMTVSEFDIHQKMLHFNPRQEKIRKDFLEHALTRTREEISEEQSLMVELKRILARTEKLNEERRELYARLDTPQSVGNISVFTSSQGLQNLLQQLMNTDKAKKRKALQEGQTPTSGTPGAQTPSGFNNTDRRESTTHRESISGPPPSTTANHSKKGSVSTPNNASERRKLSEDEERIYGVTHHDRLQGGPYFRGDKLARPLTMKSSVQQSRIKNTLMELGIPEKAMMATTEVAQGYEALFAAIAGLLDTRKVVDKLAGEIAVAREALEEKRRRRRMERGQVDGAGDEDGGKGEGKGEESGEKEKEKEKVDGEGEGEGEQAEKNQNADENNNQNGEGETTEDPQAKANLNEEVNADGEALANDETIKEEAGDQPRADTVADSESALPQKRSASVLSEGSEGSVKRQRK
ncbi:swr1-complex 4 protein [Rutstroemia sp. NJR-2017a WRK4]|nr:swr1-complex 4 protein [Rutstroemia sp. NJR-2017a WRK4]